MRERWLSRRACALHVAVVLWVPLCLLAGWWQVTRALDGNGLSYLYSAEWPLFALVGVLAWWSLIHTDPQTVGAAAQRRMLSVRSPSTHAGGPSDGRIEWPADQLAAEAPTADRRKTDVVTIGSPARRRGDEDAALAAYNDRLAALAADGRPKTWRHR